jgi:PAS domain S-box-containing protein
MTVMPDSHITPHALLAAIVESSDDAIVSKNTDGIVTSWNRAAERMFGFTAAEAIGQSILLISPQDRVSEENFVLSQIRGGHAIDHFETIRQRKDGTLIDVSLTVSPIRDESGRVIGASKIARDISEQKRLRRELADANRLKDEFLATLSHELRTPLHSILGYTQILRHGGLEEDRRDSALQIIERNAKTLAQLVADVLDVSRIVTGKIRLESEPRDLGPIVSAALDSVEPAFSAKGVRLDRMLEARPITVMGDASRLQQVMWNLLTNAVKFTPAGGRVRVVLGHTRTEAEITVTDTGIGIEPEFLPHLFERFSQADSRSTRQYTGLGLGLALVRHFIELHGGSVQAHSEGTDRGSTFRLKIPLAPQALDDVELEVHDRDRAAFTGRLADVTVLAVDDDPDSLQLLEEILTSAGANVMCASSTSGALRLLDLRLPDVIVSDIGMPGRDGFDLIGSLRRRRDDQGGSIPAAALTAYVRPDDRRRALDAGFQIHLGKPIDPDELISAVETLSSHSQDAVNSPSAHS